MQEREAPTSCERQSRMISDGSRQLLPIGGRHSSNVKRQSWVNARCHLGAVSLATSDA